MNLGMKEGFITSVAIPVRRGLIRIQRNLRLYAGIMNLCKRSD